MYGLNEIIINNSGFTNDDVAVLYGFIAGLNSFRLINVTKFVDGRSIETMLCAMHYGQIVQKEAMDSLHALDALSYLVGPR